MAKKAIALLIIGFAIVVGAGLSLRSAPGDPRPEREGGAPPAGAQPEVPAGMVLVQGGSFDMGDLYGEGAGNARPVHTVAVSSFFIAKYDVTFEEYDEFCAAAGSEVLSDMGWGRGRMPVINVTWFEAVSYCNWLSAKQGLKPCYAIDGRDVACDFGVSGYRLPTEAEWEYAARERGGKIRFGNGKEIADAAEINFNAEVPTLFSVIGLYRGRSTPVESFGPNELGLFDMAGNVWQWCWDWYDVSYYAKSPVNDPRGAESGAERVLRGGAWHNPADKSRAMCRGYYNPSARYADFGFRVVRSQPQELAHRSAGGHIVAGDMESPPSTDEFVRVLVSFLADAID